MFLFPWDAVTMCAVHCEWVLLLRIKQCLDSEFPEPSLVYRILRYLLTILNTLDYSHRQISLNFMVRLSKQCLWFQFFPLFSIGSELLHYHWLIELYSGSLYISAQNTTHVNYVPRRKPFGFSMPLSIFVPLL